MNTRHVWLVGGLMMLSAAPKATKAQSVEFELSDSALVMLTGDSAYADLLMRNSGGTSDWEVTLQFDDSRLTVIGADTVPGWGSLFNAPSIVTAPDQATVTGSGTGTVSFTNRVARVWFRLDSAATEGTLLSLRLDSLLNQAGADALAMAPHFQVPMRVCRANRTYGDVDVDRRITARDALITLTESVGIATTGFELQWSDVDLDGLSSSRDALFILSDAVGTNTGTQAGNHVADACDPLTPAPTQFMFFNTSTGDLEMVAPGDTVPVVIPRTTGFDTQERPSFSPDGLRVAYEWSGWLVAVNTDGSGPDTLTTTCCVEAPSWSPDGTQIAFVARRSSRDAIWLIDADGQNEYQLTPNLTEINDLQWASDGSRLLFSAYDSLSLTLDHRVWSINPDSTGLAQVETAEPGWLVDDLTVSPAVDSAAYRYNGFLYLMAVTDTVASPVSNVTSFVDDTWWDAAGIMYSAFLQTRQRVYLREAGTHRLRQLTRNATYNVSRLTAFSGSPVYVSQVALAPGPLTFASTTAPPQTLTATVTNSDLTLNTTVPVTWVSRDPLVASVDQAGNVSPVAVGGPIFVVAHVRGWRADSVQVTVN